MTVAGARPRYASQRSPSRGSDDTTPSAAELWTPVTERVELAPFAAGIDARRQFRQEVSVVLPTHEALVQLLGVHAGQHLPGISELRRKLLHEIVEGCLLRHHSLKCMAE